MPRSSRVGGRGEDHGGGADGAGGGGSRRSRAWASVLHVNGVAVYVEEQDADGEGGAIMVSGNVVWPGGRVSGWSGSQLGCN